MTKARTRHELIAAPEPKAKFSRATQAAERPASAGRVFKFSLKNIPTVDARLEARLQTAARKPRKNRRYPVIIEAPDA